MISTRSDASGYLVSNRGCNVVIDVIHVCPSNEDRSMDVKVSGNVNEVSSVFDKNTQPSIVVSFGENVTDLIHFP